MNRDLTQKLAQAAACLLCAIMVWNYGIGLEGTEFSGGRVTGPLLDLYDIGSILFILAVLITFFLRRIAAAITILATLLCVPLYLYFTAPGLFRRIFRGPWAEPLQTNFVWNRWAIMGIIILSIAASVAFRSFLISGERKSQNSA